MDGLRVDPSLRFTDAGREILRWLILRLGTASQWEEIAEKIPPHCAYPVAELARIRAAEWMRFAEHLEQRSEAAS